MSALDRAAEERLANDASSELWGEHRARYRFAIAWAGGVAGLRVADVACGAGFGVQMLRRSGAEVVGFDLDEDALRQASRGAAQGLPLVRADAARLPLADSSVDLVVSMETLEHVPDAAALVRELSRILRRDGRLVLSTPNRSWGPPRLHANPFHVRELDAGELRAMLLECFEQVEIRGQRPDPAYAFVPFLMIDRDWHPRAVAWKVLNHLPFHVKDALARLWSRRGFYPGEDDFAFPCDDGQASHVLVAVASAPRTRAREYDVPLVTGPPHQRLKERAS